KQQLCSLSLGKRSLDERWSAERRLPVCPQRVCAPATVFRPAARSYPRKVLCPAALWHSSPCPAAGLGHRSNRSTRPRGHREVQIRDRQRVVIESAGKQRDRGIQCKGIGTLADRQATGARNNIAATRRRPTDRRSSTAGGQREVLRSVIKSQSGLHVAQAGIKHPTIGKGTALIAQLTRRGWSGSTTPCVCDRCSSRRGRSDAPIRDRQRVVVAIEVAGIQLDDVVYLRPSIRVIFAVSDC